MFRNKKCSKTGPGTRAPITTLEENASGNSASLKTNHPEQSNHISFSIRNLRRSGERSDGCPIKSASVKTLRLRQATALRKGPHQTTVKIPGGRGRPHDALRLTHPQSVRPAVLLASPTQLSLGGCRPVTIQRLNRDADDIAEQVRALSSTTAFAAADGRTDIPCASARTPAARETLRDTRRRVRGASRPRSLRRVASQWKSDTAIGKANTIEEAWHVGINRMPRAILIELRAIFGDAYLKAQTFATRGHCRSYAASTPHAASSNTSRDADADTLSRPPPRASKPLVAPRVAPTVVACAKESSVSPDAAMTPRQGKRPKDSINRSTA